MDDQLQPVPFFSANDVRIDPSDPVLQSFSSVGGLPYPRPQRTDLSADQSLVSALRARPGFEGGRFPVNIEGTGYDDDDDSGLLYSFSTPPSKQQPSKPPSVAESFGVYSTQVCVCVCVCVRACVHVCLCVCVHFEIV